jgi:hypothetical protein
MTVAYPSRRDPYGSPPFRSTLNLSLPPDFTAGMYATELAIASDHARGCVLLQIMTAAHQEDIEIVLAPASALDAVLKLIGALTKLEQGEPT